VPASDRLGVRFRNHRDENECGAGEGERGQAGRAYA
jgi:hypothetical protein